MVDERTAQQIIHTVEYLNRQHIPATPGRIGWYVSYSQRRMSDFVHLLVRRGWLRQRLSPKSGDPSQKQGYEIVPPPYEVVLKADGVVFKQLQFHFVNQASGNFCHLLHTATNALQPSRRANVINIRQLRLPNVA